MDGEDVTAVMARHSRTNKTLAVFLGLATAVCPAVAGYFAYRQAKVEGTARSAENHREAAIGYRTLADPVELMTTLVQAHEKRIATLEVEVRECETHASFSPPPSLTPPALTPLVRLKPLPRTLGDAAAAAK